MITRGRVTLVSLLVGLSVTMFASFASPQGDQQAVAAFEQKVALFKKFFAEKPFILDKSSAERSPTGFVFVYWRSLDATISYDVRKTDSLVSPYMGYITVDPTAKETRNCGSVDFGRTVGKAFATVGEARQSRDDDSCYVSRTSEGGGIRFIFAFQKQQWVFRDLENVGQSGWSDVFWPALGKSVEDRFAVEDNNNWLTLIR